MEFTELFTIIGDEETQSSDLAPTSPATVVAIDQVLFAEVDEPWKKGERIGEAHGTAVSTPSGNAVCHITFTFGDEDSVVAHGVLPVDGSNLGGGHLAVAGGTGYFHKATGRVDLETLNPKRWSFAL
jgi:hypothetical protein